MMPSNMARIAVFATPEFALPSLRRLQARHDVALVICRPDARQPRGGPPLPCPVRVEATRLGLPVAPSNLATEADVAAIIRALGELRVDLGVMIAFGPELLDDLLRIPTQGFVMAHASLLPRWRGAAPVERALEAGDTHTGVSLVRLTADRYAGDIYLAERIAIAAADDAISLTARLAEVAANLLECHLDDIASGKQAVTPQSESGITEARKIESHEFDLSWTWTADETIRKARAFVGRSPLKLKLDRAGVDVRRARTLLGPDWRDAKLSVSDPQTVALDHESLPGTLLPSSSRLVFAFEPGRAVAFSHVQLSGRMQWPGTLLLQELGLTGQSESATMRRSKLVSAALRHVRVAEHLVADGPARSLDEAFHLAGFGPECVQAACLDEDWFARAIGHGFHAGASEILKLLLSLDPRARRYLPADWGAQFSVLNQWTVDSRYQSTGTFDLTSATAITQAARAVVDRVVTSLWADGLLDQGALR